MHALIQVGPRGLLRSITKRAKPQALYATLGELGCTEVHDVIEKLAIAYTDVSLFGHFLNALN